MIFYYSQVEIVKYRSFGMNVSRLLSCAVSNELVGRQVKNLRKLLNSNSRGEDHTTPFSLYLLLPQEVGSKLAPL